MKVEDLPVARRCSDKGLVYWMIRGSSDAWMRRNALTKAEVARMQNPYDVPDIQEASRLVSKSWSMIAARHGRTGQVLVSRFFRIDLQKLKRSRK